MPLRRLDALAVVTNIAGADYACLFFCIGYHPVMTCSIPRSLARFGLAVALLLGVAGSSACVDGTACTLESRPSLTITVVDAQSGDPVEGAMVTFQVDGGEVRTPADTADNTFTLARDQAGVFKVTIEADGYEPASAEYTVDEDECHVIPVDDTVELVPLP